MKPVSSATETIYSLDILGIIINVYKKRVIKTLIRTRMCRLIFFLIVRIDINRFCHGVTNVYFLMKHDEQVKGLIKRTNEHKLFHDIKLANSTLLYILSKHKKHSIKILEGAFHYPLNLSIDMICETSDYNMRKKNAINIPSWQELSQQNLVLS